MSDETRKVLETVSQTTKTSKSGFAVNTLARLAGLLYLILIPTSGVPFGVGQFLMAGDAATAFARIQASHTLFRLAIVIGAVGFIDYLLLGLVLYKLLHPVGKAAAATMLAFVAVSVPVSLAAVARWVDVLSLLQSADRLSADTLHTQVMLALRGYNNLILVSAIFWGLWLIPLGWLVVRSGFMPRMIGVLLMLGSAFYVMTFAGPVFDPGYADTVAARIVGIASGIPGLLGELSTCLWLLIVGVRDPGAAVNRF